MPEFLNSVVKRSLSFSKSIALNWFPFTNKDFFFVLRYKVSKIGVAILLEMESNLYGFFVLTK